MNAKIIATYPTLCELLKGTTFEDDMALAERTVADLKGEERLEGLLDSKGFQSNSLMSFALFNTLLPYSDSTLIRTDHDLATLIAVAGLDKVKSTYRDKLLNKSATGFEDALYEIAAAAICCGFLDQGTFRLEERIGETKKNSDVAGRHTGKLFRFEVTVLHDDWPPRLDAQHSRIIESADIDAGYTVVLNRLCYSDTDAQDVRRHIEELYPQHQADPTQDLAVDGYTLWASGDEYRSSDENCLFARVSFVEDRNVRLSAIVAGSRNTIDPHEIEDWENPKGVFNISDATRDSRTHKTTPLSTKIKQMIAGKLSQCEEGVANIIVLGQPRAMNDRSFDDALQGACVLIGNMTEGEGGVGMLGEAGLYRKATKPFVPAAQSEDAEQFVDPFRVVSAIWVLRLDTSNPQSDVVRNPNATVPIDDAEAHALQNLGMSRCRLQGPLAAEEEESMSDDLLADAFVAFDDAKSLMGDYYLWLWHDWFRFKPHVPFVVRLRDETGAEGQAGADGYDENRREIVIWTGEYDLERQAFHEFDDTALAERVEQVTGQYAWEGWKKVIVEELCHVFQVEVLGNDADEYGEFLYQYYGPLNSPAVKHPPAFATAVAKFAVQCGLDVHKLIRTMWTHLSATSPPVDDRWGEYVKGHEIPHQETAFHAFLRWEHGDMADGHDQEDWFLAKQERRAARRVRLT